MEKLIKLLASAKLAYERFKEIFDGAEWQELKENWN